MLSFLLRNLIPVILTFFLLSCASDKLDSIRNDTKNWSAEKIYARANKELVDKNYNEAIKYYRVLEATYPYGKYAQNGMLDLAYAYYSNNEAEFAIPEIDQFMRLYPNSPNMDYALYLKGYINYFQDNGFLAKLGRQDLSERDPKSLREAYDAFFELVNKFPNSRYVDDAKIKINRIVNGLSRGELYRAGHYMQIKAYLAAINRTQTLIKNYPETKYVEDALAIQVVAYKKLGERELSEKSQKVLLTNFPQSPYIKKPWEFKDVPWYSFWRSQ
jgi:outer membrane protein assembly factor BamD